MRVEYAIVHEILNTGSGAAEIDIVQDYGEQLDLAQAKGEVDQSRQSVSLVAYVFDTDPSGEEDLIHSLTLYPREEIYNTYEATLGWWKGGFIDVQHRKVTQTHWWHHYRFIDWRGSEPANTPHVLVIEEIDNTLFVDHFEQTRDEARQQFNSHDEISQEN